MNSRVSTSMEMERFSSWKQRFSGKDKMMVSAAASCSFAKKGQEQQPRKLKIRVKLPPLAACGLVKNSDGTCTVRPIRGSGKQMKILRAALLNNNLDLPEKVSSDYLQVKKPEPEPFSATSRRKLNQPHQSVDRRKKVRAPLLNNNIDLPGKPSFGSVSVQTETTTKQSFSVSFGNVDQNRVKVDTGLEMKLEASKRKAQQQYQSIEDGRKRIKTIEFRDIPDSPEKPNYYCRRPMVNIKRK